MDKSATLTIGIDASRAATLRQTGTERYSRRIIEELLACGNRHRYLLYVNQDAPAALPSTDRSTQRLIPFPRLWTHVRLSAELLRHPVDALFVPAHVVPLIHPRATVVTIHDLGYFHEPEAHTDWARRHLDWSTRWSARSARRVIAISGATRDDLVARYNIPAEKIHVIHHGIDQDFRLLDPVDVTSKLHQLGVTQPYILFVGTLQPRKNIVRLIAAFDLLADNHTDFNLVLVGKPGWLFNEIESALGQSRHRDRVTILGHVPDSFLPALYNGAEVCALPSLYEGFGLPVLEAMACGTPMVISDRGALPEIAGDAALIIDPLDARSIAEGLGTALRPETKAELVAKGRARAESFRWAVAAERTLAVIEEAVAASQGR